MICDALENNWEERWEGSHELREIFLKNNPILLEALRKMTTLPGDHNLQNVAIAVEIARWMGMSENEIATAVRSFKGLPHRLEYVAEEDGVVFINDSKATSAEPLIMALQSFPGASIFLIAGGMAKSDGIASAIPYMGNVEEVFLIGEASERFTRELSGKKVSCFGGLVEATEAAFLAAKRGEARQRIVLLSPACASFDQFANFEERGDLFKKTVAGLLANSPEELRAM
jgi:UDP-N-acetylmuramoylalanine--D-glutamate ligase